MKLGCLSAMLLTASLSWAKGVEPKKLDRKDWSQWPSCNDTSWNNMVANYKLTCPNLDLVWDNRDPSDNTSLYELYCFTDRNGDGKFQWAFDDIIIGSFCNSYPESYGAYHKQDRTRDGDTPYQEVISSNQTDVLVDSQTSKVSVPIIGTNWVLTYSSLRTLGYKPANQLRIQYLNPNLGSTPNDGVHFMFFFDPQQPAPTFEDDAPVVAGGVYTYNWNHKDNNGVFIAKPQRVWIRTYYDWPTATPATTYKYTTYWDHSHIVGNYLPQRIGMSGWNVTPVHYLDEARSKLWRGDGTVEDVTYQTLTNSNLRVLSKDGKELYIFNPNGRHLSTKSTLNGEIIYLMDYNSSGYLTKITDAFGNETVFNRSGQVLTSIVAPGGRNTTIGASISQITTITNPAGESHVFTYASEDLLLTHTYPNLQVTTFTYDTDGRVTNTAEQFGSTWTLTRDTNDSTLPVYNKTALNRTTKATKTDLEKLVIYPWGSQEHIYHNGGPYSSYSHYDLRNTVSYAADPIWTGLGTPFWTKFTNKIDTDTGLVGYEVNHTKTVTLANPADFFTVSTINESFDIDGKITQRTYDDATKTYTTTTPMSYVCKNKIDIKERPVETQRGSETPWTFTYNTINGKIAEISQGGRYKNTFVYDSNNNLSSITNALNQVTSFTYDSADRVVSQTLPNTKVIAYEYDYNGNLKGVTPPSRPKHIFAFNLFDGISQYTPPTVTGSGNTTYAYNLDQQLSTFTKATGDYASYTYDSATGLLNEIKINNDVNKRYTISYYTNSIKPQDLTSPDGIKSHMAWYGFQPKTDQQRRTSDNVLFSQVNWTYNSYHLPASRSVVGKDSSGSTINYTYNNDFQPTQVGDMQMSYYSGNGRLFQTQIGKVIDSRVYDSNGDLSEYTASFDTGLSRLFSVTTLYTYALVRDDLGRITQKTETIGGVTDVWNYEYDTAGQLTKVKKNGVVFSEYVYDDNGNRTSGKTAGTSFTATYNNQDRLLTYNTRTYAYNANGDLGQIQWNTTQSSYYQYDMFGNYSQFIGTGGGVFNFIHDAFNRRVGLKQGSTVTYRFLYQDQYRVAAQTQGDGKVLKEYFYATGSNSPDYMVDYTSTPAVKYRIIKDHLGSPRLVVNTASNITVQRLDYNDLGEITSETGTAFFQPFAFAGGLHEPNSKMVRFGARDYDPRTGRWTTKDPILFAGGNANLYGYTINDPVNFVDPEGLKTTVYRDGIHFILGVTNPASRTGITYMDFYSGNDGLAAMLGMVVPGQIDIESSYVGSENFKVWESYNTTPDQEKIILDRGKQLQELNRKNLYHYSATTLPGITGTSGNNCISFVNEVCGEFCK